MAESKQYIVQNQEKGKVMISEDVVAAIVLHAMSEIDGFAGVNTKHDLVERIGKSWGKGIKVVITDENELSIECNIHVFYGCSVMAVAKEIQQNVVTELESVTGAKVANVNVNVCGIIRK